MYWRQPSSRRSNQNLLEFVCWVFTVRPLCCRALWGDWRLCCVRLVLLFLNPLSFVFLLKNISLSLKVIIRVSCPQLFWYCEQFHHLVWNESWYYYRHPWWRYPKTSLLLSNLSWDLCNVFSPLNISPIPIDFSVT